MKPNRPPIPWGAIRALVRYLERHSQEGPHPANIGPAVREVRDWLDPKKQPDDPNQISMLEKW